MVRMVPSDWIVWRDERDDGVRSLQRHIEHRVYYLRRWIGLALTASILTVSTDNARCRSSRATRQHGPHHGNRFRLCTEWITRFEVGSSTRG
jgi:hypothetical protein